MGQVQRLTVFNQGRQISERGFRGIDKMAEAGISRTGKTPEHTKDHQLQYGLATTLVPLGTYPLAGGQGRSPGKTFQLEKQSPMNATVWSDTMSLQTVGQQCPVRCFSGCSDLQVFQRSKGFLQNFLRVAGYHQAVVADEQFVRDTGETW